MKSLKVLLSVFVFLCAGATASYGWELRGYVHCDGNKNGQLDGQDVVLPGVVVNVVNLAGTYHNSGMTGQDGFYIVGLLDTPDSYIATIDSSSIPADGVVVVPAGGQLQFDATAIDFIVHSDWLVQSDTCQPGNCWLTGGGTKWDNIANTYVAEKGTKTTFGGNVHPGCSATAGAGGDWNNVDRAGKLHFHGTDIPTVVCGNVDDYPPGSSSPKTPFNYIEFKGTGWVKGIQGNKANYPLVYFFGRAEDRNEPGSNGAKDGSNIDRYFLRVYTNPNDPIGSTLILVDDDGVNDVTVDATTITTGNLQIHVSSCDNPPLQ
jgi:hypothetical protein